MILQLVFYVTEFSESKSNIQTNNRLIIRVSVFNKPILVIHARNERQTVPTDIGREKSDRKKCRVL